MPQGGMLTISARHENNLAFAEVRDQGGGIPQDMHEKIFELYFTTKKEGSGIGLAQAYQVLQWHYGSLDFESAAGVGTIFRFQIPLSGLPEAGHDYATDTATSQRGD
jgi:signal transduction histidine kinase